MAPRLDFTSEAFFRDPPRAIATLRMSGPVVAARFPIVGDVWITTTHEATAQVLKDGTNFTLRKEDRRRRGPALVDAELRQNHRQQHADDGRAGPHKAAQHRGRGLSPPRDRRRWSRASAPSRTSLADELFSAGSPADLVQRYARILPLAVISELLGCRWPIARASSPGPIRCPRLTERRQLLPTVVRVPQDASLPRTAVAALRACGAARA